jgi:long-chain acyl-CoA synthetase
VRGGGAGGAAGPAVLDRLREATGETLVELLDRAVARHPGRTAMVLRGDGPAEAWTYLELASATRRAAARLHDAGVRPGDRVLTWAPSDPWLAIACFGAWRLGAELMLGRIETEAARRGAIDRLRRARRLALALRLPMALRRWLFRAVLNGFGGHRALLGSGGARMPEDLQLAWEAMGIRVIQAYGATECAAIAGHDRERRRPGTVGPPLAGTELCIAEDGELLARGPNASSGYWGRPDETAEVLAGGAVHTGDAARIDEHGEVVILGRTRDRIALPNGTKVYPEDVEQALRTRGGGAVVAAAVLEGTPGQLVAILVPAGADIGDDALDAAVREANATLAPHQRVRRWRRWPDADFPRTHTLEVRRPLVAQWYGEQLRAGEGAATEGGDS